MFRRLACFILLFLNAKYACSSDLSGLHYCIEDNMTIPMEKLCDNEPKCLHGSDESTVLCKRNEPSWDDLFQCANGVLINSESRCDGKYDCLDRSDEADILCFDELNEIDQKNYTIQQRGICEEHQVKCPHSLKCIHEDQRCDNIIDCLNGWDESTEVCMSECNDEQFLCGNGICISQQNLCNNKPDCIDGSDELPVICKDPQQNPNHANWLHKEPASCTEPIKQNLQFDKDTKFYFRPTEKFVYANMAVRFECYNRKRIISGSEWNICNNTGQWHYPLPQCEKVNTDPETNGTKGCPIDTYNDYKDTMKLFDCDRSNCIPILPNETNSKNVKFECEVGFVLWPDLPPRYCKDNKWMGEGMFRSPRCVKFCNPDELYCLDSSKPACRDESHTEIACKTQKGLPPQTTAIIGCNPGFKSVDPTLVKCLEDGTWENISNISKACEFDCKNSVALSANLPVTKLEKKSSTVFLYLYNKTTTNYDYNCGGTIIRPNVIITAAHCVADHETKDIRVIRQIKKSYLNNTEGWTVIKKTVVPGYDDIKYYLDVALLQLETKSDDDNMAFAICLPGYSIEIPTNFSLGIGEFNSLETQENDTVGSLLKGTVEVNQTLTTELEYHVNLKAGGKFCKGDSGSGFIAFCPGSNLVNCLYGVLSHTSGTSDGKKACGSKVAVARTTHLLVNEEIKKFISEIEHRCS